MADRNSGLNRPLTQSASRETPYNDDGIFRVWLPPIDFHGFPIWFQVNTLVFLPLVAGNLHFQWYEFDQPPRRLVLSWPPAGWMWIIWLHFPCVRFWILMECSWAINIKTFHEIPLAKKERLQPSFFLRDFHSIFM